MDFIPASHIDDVLVIAPKTDLAYVDEEVSAVVNLLHARVLQGTVTYDDIVDELSEHKPKALWFATHGVEVERTSGEGTRAFHLTESGILLSEGKILTPALLVPLFNLSKIEFVFLNTCRSLELALAIQNEIDVNFLCTIRDVPDEQAFRTGKTFAIHLARGLSYHDAWIQARPGRNSTFVYLAGRPKMSPPVQLSEGEFDANFTLKQLVAVINGDPKWNTPGILPVLNSLVDDMERLRWSILFLRVVCALLFVMTFFTILAVFSLVRVSPLVQISP